MKRTVMFLRRLFWCWEVSCMLIVGPIIALPCSILLALALELDLAGALAMFAVVWLATFPERP